MENVNVFENENVEFVNDEMIEDVVVEAMEDEIVEEKVVDVEFNDIEEDTNNFFNINKEQETIEISIPLIEKVVGFFKAVWKFICHPVKTVKAWFSKGKAQQVEEVAEV